MKTHKKPLRKATQPIITTENLFLRAPEFLDNSAIFTMRSNTSNAKYLDRPLAKSIAEADEFIERISEGIEKGSTYYWVITQLATDKTVGTICLWNFNNNNTIAEIGFELLPEFHGKGIMQEVIPSILSYGFAILHLSKITAEVGKGNVKSIALLEKFGFMKESRQTSSNAPVFIYSLAYEETDFR